MTPEPPVKFYAYAVIDGRTQEPVRYELTRKAARQYFFSLAEDERANMKVRRAKVTLFES